MWRWVANQASLQYVGNDFESESISFCVKKRWGIEIEITLNKHLPAICPGERLQWPCARSDWQARRRDAWLRAKASAAQVHLDCLFDIIVGLLWDVRNIILWRIWDFLWVVGLLVNSMPRAFYVNHHNEQLSMRMIRVLDAQCLKVGQMIFKMRSIR